MTKQVTCSNKVRIYARTSGQNNDVLFLTSLVDSIIFKGAKICQIQINEIHYNVDLTIEQIFIHFGKKTVEVTQLDVAYKGLLKLSIYVNVLNVLPVVKDGWEIDERVSVFFHLNQVFRKS